MQLESSFLPLMTAQAVSSQLLSMPKITGSGLILKLEISYISKYLRRGGTISAAAVFPQDIIQSF